MVRYFDYFVHNLGKNGNICNLVTVLQSLLPMLTKSIAVLRI